MNSKPCLINDLVLFYKFNFFTNNEKWNNGYRIKKQARCDPEEGAVSQLVYRPFPE